MNIDNILENFNDRETACRFSGVDVRKNILVGVIPYLVPILFFLPVLVDKERKSVFCKFHANQQFTWFLLTAVIELVKHIIGIIPLIGGLVYAVLALAELLIGVSLAYGTYKGKALRLPFIGDLIDIF
ncbi:MAG: hypothetical protein K2G36_05185 [Ruminococcus sp.]|nr:hypothetical protein [Ruminococcus sp.]